MRAAGAELPNSDRAKACCHEKARQGRGCLCKTVLHYAKNRIGGICPCIPLSVASVPLFDLKPAALGSFVRAISGSDGGTVREKRMKVAPSPLLYRIFCKFQSFASYNRIINLFLKIKILYVFLFNISFKNSKLT